MEVGVGVELSEDEFGVYVNKVGQACVRGHRAALSAVEFVAR